MSYDISVYTPSPLTLDDLLALVRGTAGLDVEGELSRDAESLMVVRGAKRGYSFTIDGPFEVEAEDLPAEVTASVLGAKAVYQVMVEGSDEVSVPHAVKFARKLAKTSGGAVFDEQSEDVWPKSKGNRIAAPSGSMITDRVDVIFYFLNQDSPNDLPQIFLRLARKYLPEALPRRFGEYEPLRGNLARDGDQAFIDAADNTGSSGLSLVGNYPVCGGYYDKDSEMPVGRLSLYLDKTVFSDRQWRDALQAFFIAFATESRSFFASAEVLREFVLSQRGFGSTSASERRLLGAIGGTWKGLHPYPHWWTWFSPDYVQLVSPHLTGHREMHDDNLFHSWSEEPLNRDQLTALLPDPTQPWIPSDLQSIPNSDGLLDQAAKIVPARLAPNPSRH
ncbi:hypothetical protein SAMN04489740_4141 [Arthrobacter alpinus]|uniref:Uncharacterized protein n=1 Tax=Arthrobacter alpinus TaxID=656366 RepID=A0A1H5PD03_9MICC|nr:hypothetical protein [Arthrobacter alpinus]SEF11773.1 hypothetical protein SAMN04489740_4141 [Arthrobacter alpinus]